MNASKRFAVTIEEKNVNIWVLNIRDRESNTITPIFITDKIDLANKKKIIVLDDLLIMESIDFKNKWLKGGL
tara:strand:- start:1724 stop:1939 length:216 start_codon:yes stop_codon:yes gene_type:complete